MKVKFVNPQGAPVEADLSASLYQEAHDKDMTVSAYLSSKYKTDESKYGSVLDQMMASAGLFSEGDPSLGITPTTVRAAMEGSCDSMYMQGGTNVADASPASRILFPVALLRTVENKLYANRNGEIALFDSMVAQRETVAGQRYEHLVLDFTRPEQARSSRISQLAEPNLMMLITASEKQGSIPTFSLGIQISDQARQNATMDFVAMSMARQAEIESAAKLDEQMRDMIYGNVDNGQAALVPVKVNVYDPSIDEAGIITHKAWLKYLWANRRTCSIDYVWMTIDTFLKVETRPGQPKAIDDNTSVPANQRPNSVITLLNLDIQGIKVFIVEPTVVAEDMIVGLDSRYAMRKVTNSQAEYKAAERLAMRRAESMRWDWGYVVHRLWDEAWKVLSLTV